MNLPTACVRAVRVASPIDEAAVDRDQRVVHRRDGAIEPVPRISFTCRREFTGLLFHAVRGSADGSSWPKSAKPDVTSCAIVENAHDG